MSLTYLVTVVTFIYESGMREEETEGQAIRENGQPRSPQAPPHRSSPGRLEHQVGSRATARRPQVKGLVVNALGRGFDLEDVDIAAPIGREVLVNVQASGLCHTDLRFATHDIVPTPVVLGHEVAGIVSAVGPEVVQLHVGDHVVGSLAQSCGTCARCLSGRPVQCIHPESTLRRPTDALRLSRNGAGLFQDFGLGGFAERALIHANQLAVEDRRHRHPGETTRRGQAIRRHRHHRLHKDETRRGRPRFPSGRS